MAKYHNRKTTTCGIVFDSKKEAFRFLYLKGLKEGGTITNLQLQPVFELLPQNKWADPVKRDRKGYKTSTIRPITYLPDFQYTILKECVLDINGVMVRVYPGETIIEDVKGMRTTEYRLKRKLFLATYPELLFFET